MADNPRNTGNTQISSLWKLIGNTPFIAIRYRYQAGPEQEILVKCEQYNMTGSIKDCIALYTLQKAKEQNKLRYSDTIVEATPGNSGVSFAVIGKALGHRVKIIAPDWISQEQKAIIKNQAAEIQLVSKAEGGLTGAIRIAEAMGHYDGVFLPRQFKEWYHTEAHEKTTGREIDHSLILEKIQPDAFVSGVGTGGTIVGVGSYLKSIYPAIKIYPLEPCESTTPDGDIPAVHRIRGISESGMPSILQPGGLQGDGIRVKDGDAILMAQKLKHQLDLGVGISSGANLVGAIKLHQRLGQGKWIITIFPDDHKKYVGTDLFREEPPGSGYMTPDIEFINYRALTSVSKTLYKP